MILQILTAYGAYIFGKFACKVQIQAFSYSVPLAAAVPATLALLLTACGERADDPCALHGLGVPDYLFFECPAVGDYWEYMKRVRACSIYL
jgi:chitin synthase